MPSDGSCIAYIVSPSIDRDGWLDTLLSHKPRLTSQSGRGFSMLRRIIQDADNPNAVNIAGIVGNHGVAGLADSPASKPFLDCDGTKPYADADNASKKAYGGDGGRRRIMMCI